MGCDSSLQGTRISIDIFISPFHPVSSTILSVNPEACHAEGQELGDFLGFRWPSWFGLRRRKLLVDGTGFMHIHCFEVEPVDIGKRKVETIHVTCCFSHQGSNVSSCCCLELIYIIMHMHLEPKWPLLIGKDLVLEGWSPKIEDKQVPGIHISVLFPMNEQLQNGHLTAVHLTAPRHVWLLYSSVWMRFYVLCFVFGWLRVVLHHETIRS